MTTVLINSNILSTIQRTEREYLPEGKKSLQEEIVLVGNYTEFILRC